MRLTLALSVTILACAVSAQEVPLPKQRPLPSAERAGTVPSPISAPAAVMSLAPVPELQTLPFGDSSPGPSACDRRLAEIAEFTPQAAMVGPGECGAAEVVRLEAILLRDRTRIPLSPPATLRCSMAETLAHFVRDDVAPVSGSLGAPFASIISYDSYECRGRNRVAGARVSEHGKGNAIDIRGLRLANGHVVELTSPIVDKEFRDRVRLAACTRFSTVLGPGSDGYHENHIHLDLAERNRGYRMCQWDVREPPVATTVPLPQPRPVASSDKPDGTERK